MGARPGGGPNLMWCHERWIHRTDIALAVAGIVMYWAMAVLERRMTGSAQSSGFARIYWGRS